MGRLQADEHALPRLIMDGVAIERFKNRQIEDACRNATEIELAGHKILAVNATVNFSEVAGNWRKPAVWCGLVLPHRR